MSSLKKLLPISESTGRMKGLAFAADADMYDVAEITSSLIPGTLWYAVSVVTAVPPREFALRFSRYESNINGNEFVSCNL